MTAACHDSGLADPVFDEIGTRFRVTLATARQQAPLMDELDQTILSVLTRESGRSTQEVADAIKRSTRATRPRLARLIERGLVSEVGTGPQDPKRRYYLSKNG